MIIIKSAEPSSTKDLIDMEIEVNGQIMNATMPYETAIAFKDYVLKDYDDRMKENEKVIKRATIQIVIASLLLIAVVVNIVISLSK